MGTIEEGFNFALGEVLPQVNPKWSPSTSIYIEKTGLIEGTNLRPDILISDSTTPPVVIENSYDPKDANKDALSRLGCKLRRTGGTIETSIAVHIPKRFRSLDSFEAREALLEGEAICYAVYQRLHKEEGHKNYRRWVEEGFVEGTACDLARFVYSASLPKETLAHIADDVAKHLEQAASILEENLTLEQQAHVTDVVRQVTNLKGLRTASVLWLNAFVVQRRLANLGVPQSEFIPVVNKRPMPSEILSIWTRILEQNWHSIFYPAVESMKVVATLNPKAASDAALHVILGVERIFTCNWEVLFNVGAELFPRLSDDRKQAAAFYTQPATAELLASLAIQKDDFESDIWASESFPIEHTIADLACGTGTLLRAGYQRIRRFHEECSDSADSSRSFHRNATEHGLIGIDVSPIAAHLASSTLAIQGYGDAYSQTQIGWCEVGGVRSATGSIELFEESKIKDLFDQLGHSIHGRQTPSAMEDPISVADNSVGYILMNPPYSRTRGGQSAFDIAGLSDIERKECQNKWGKLIANEPANKKAGMAATFLALAKKKLEIGGRMGFVLPLTAAFAESWQETRAMIENDFEDIVVIAVSGGKALGDEAFSADTGMEEMLLVCRRKSHQQVLFDRHYQRGLIEKKSESTRSTKEVPSIFCVTLRDPPQRLGESGEVAKAILRSYESMRVSLQTHQRPIRLGKSEIGHIIRFETKGEGDPWDAIGLKSPELAFTCRSLQRGIVEFANEQYPFEIPMCTVDELFEVGPTHDLIGSTPDSSSPRGVFDIFPIIDDSDAIGRDRLMWSVDAKKQDSLLSIATHKGVPKNSASIKEVESVRKTCSTLFYNKNMRWTSQKLLSTITQQSYGGGQLGCH
ncbi:MAG: hypothetical protein OXI60_08185 [Acidiferrobacterales bacterium]|nr:hypothetical protein [Acidiferrobacterales bacterium]